jgi:hypothetical protein
MAAPSGTCCVGHFHAQRDKGKTMCPGGGTCDGIGEATDNVHDRRIDRRGKGGWRGERLEGCPASTVWMATGHVLAPRCAPGAAWC